MPLAMWWVPSWGYLELARRRVLAGVHPAEIPAFAGMTCGARMTRRGNCIGRPGAFRLRPTFAKATAGRQNAKLKTIVVNAGEIVESPPMTMHAMRFLEDSSFIVLTTESRDQKKYEKDTVRVKLI